MSDKIEILAKLDNDHSINYTLDKTNITFEKDGKKFQVSWDSLWGCQPELANIEYIIKYFESKECEWEPINYQ